ncbi:hypothetical protein JL722_11194 [Aureococcus anophagefferens]|nr:hypothetical protein JL722_11194 [Aureococcus anophagefferens]
MAAYYRCIGTRGASMRAGASLSSPPAGVVLPGEVVRGLELATVEGKARVRVEAAAGAGWATLALFVPDGRASDGAAPAAEADDVAALLDATSRRGSTLRTRKRGAAPGYGAAKPTALPIDPRPLPRSFAWDAHPLVSVVAPTTPSRRWAHASLYACFDRQTWPNKELVVLETGRPGDPSLGWPRMGSNGWAPAAKKAAAAKTRRPESEFFKALGDGRVAYVHEDADHPIGVKRNRLGSLAKGQIIVQFDDDDVYLADYVDRMVGALLNGSPAAAAEPRLATLGAYCCYDAARGVVCEENVVTEARRPRRRQAQPLFPPTGFGEDYALVVDAADAGAACAAFVDSTADPVCLHVLHGHSSSRTYAGRRVMGADEVAARYGPEIVALTGEDLAPSARRSARRARDRDRERRLARRRRGASSSSSDDDDGDP